MNIVRMDNSIIQGVQHFNAGNEKRSIKLFIVDRTGEKAKEFNLTIRLVLRPGMKGGGNLLCRR